MKKNISWSECKKKPKKNGKRKEKRRKKSRKKCRQKKTTKSDENTKKGKGRKHLKKVSEIRTKENKEKLGQGIKRSPHPAGQQTEKKSRNDMKDIGQSRGVYSKEEDKDRKEKERWKKI